MKSYSLTHVIIFVQMRQTILICIIQEFGACFKALTIKQKGNQLSNYLFTETGLKPIIVVYVIFEQLLLL